MGEAKLTMPIMPAAGVAANSVHRGSAIIVIHEFYVFF